MEKYIGIINVNLSYEVEVKNKKEMIEHLMNMELPHNYVEDTFELVKIEEKPVCKIYKKCPECGGKLREVDDEHEIYLWCDNCDVSIDSCGGYTK